MRKLSILFFLLSVVLLVGCDKKMSRIRQHDLNGARVALLAGSMQEEEARNQWTKAHYCSFETNEEALGSLQRGDVDVAYLDQIATYNKVFDKKKFAVAFVVNDHMPIAGALRKSDVLLEKRFATFMRKIKADGLYVWMKNRWTQNDRIDTVSVAHISLPSYNVSTRLLRVGIVGEMPPYSLYNKGTWAGFENELWSLFAQYAHYRIEFVPLDFHELLPALLEHKIDVIAATVTITEQRSRKVLFTVPYAYSCSVGIVRRKSYSMNFFAVAP